MVSEVANQMNKSITELLNGVHTAVPGKVVEFNAEKCEAVILPYGKFQKPDGSFIDYPKINEVPVYFPQGSWRNASIVFPIKKDDEVLLIMSEYTLDTWRGNGEQSENDLKFDLTNAIAIPGLFHKLPRTIQDADEQDAMIVTMQYRTDDNGDGDMDDTLQKEQRITLSPEGIKLEAKFDLDASPTTTLIEMKKKYVMIDTDHGDMFVKTGTLKVEADATIEMIAGTTIDETASGLVTIIGSNVHINP